MILKFTSMCFYYDRSLVSNLIQELPSGSFTVSNAGIQTLALEGNSINAIPTGLFDPLTSLVTLYVAVIIDL